MADSSDMSDDELRAAIAEMKRAGKGATGAEGMTDAELRAGIAEMKAAKGVPEEEQEEDDGYKLTALDMVNPAVYADAITGVGADLFKATVDTLGRAGAMLWTEVEGAADYNIERWKTDDPDAYPPRDRTDDPVRANMDATSAALNRTAPRGTGFTQGGQVLRDAITGGAGDAATFALSHLAGAGEFIGDAGRTPYSRADMPEGAGAYYKDIIAGQTDNPYLQEGLSALVTEMPFAGLGPAGKLIGKGYKAAKGGLTPGPTAPSPATAQSAAAALQTGKVGPASALVEQNLDPTVMPAAIEAGIDPTKLPPSAFMKEGPAQNIVAAGEKYLDKTMANELNTGVAEVLLQSADELLEEGRSLSVQNNKAIGDDWSNKMVVRTEAIKDRAVQYRDYVDDNVRPGDPIVTPAADNLIEKMLYEVGNEVDSLPKPLQPAAKRILAAQAQLSIVEVQYNNMVTAAKGDPIALRFAESYKQQTKGEAVAAANTRQFTFKSAKDLQSDITAVTEGRKGGSLSEVTRSVLRDIGEALGSDRLAHLEQGGNDLNNGPMLVEAQRQSNQLFDQKFRMQDNLLEVTTKKFNTSLQEAFGAAVTRAGKPAGSLGDLDTLMQIVRNPTRKPAIKPGSTPRAAPPRRTYNKDVEDMVLEGISNIVDTSGNNLLDFTQILDKKPALKKRLYDELSPDKVKAYEAYHTAGTKIVRGTKTTLGSIEFKNNVMLTDGFLRKFINVAAMGPYLLRYNIPFKMVRATNIGKKDAGKKMAKLFNNPVFMRIGIEASKRGAITQSMVNDAAKLERLKVWKDYIETLPPEMKAIAAAGGVMGLLNAEPRQTEER